ncbi:hypothetical protein U2A4042360038 [Corynebacterium striatum]|nr:hypothetical protein U2A4042360038 [Corynebacterium striatum]
MKVSWAQTIARSGVPAPVGSPSLGPIGWVLLRVKFCVLG